MTGYQYDADGTRIGNGSVTNWQSCDVTTNGYVPMTDFVLDQGGAQMTEVAVSTDTSGTTWEIGFHSSILFPDCLSAHKAGALLTAKGYSARLLT